jgi:hypothetical protein
MADDGFWDAEVFDKWVDLYAGWTSYTPVWTCSTTNPSLGNGTLTGAFRAVGKTVDFRLRWVAGSTTTYGDGQWSFTLPRSPTATQSAPGIAINGAAGMRFVLACVINTAGVSRMATNGTAGVSTNAGTPANSVPFQWSNGAQLLLGGVYEAS